LGHLAIGVLVCGVLAAASMALSTWSPMAHLGLGALTLAIVLGLVVGNLMPGWLHQRARGGVDFSKGTLLRAGVALFGLHLTLQQIVAVGPRGVITDLLVIAGVLIVALVVGVRLLGMDRETALLVATGSAICGAAAVMAAEPVVRGQPHKVAVAVATVAIFGTCSIFLYPLLFPYADMSSSQFGVYIGSTIHEVAQVVAAGRSISPATADEAVIVKLIRVLLLAPFLLVLAGLLRVKGGEKRRGLPIPMFVILFAVAAGINSLGVIPPLLRSGLLHLDGWLLAFAMAALGWATHARMLRDAGIRPVLLGLALFVFLVVGGWLINEGVGIALAHV
jgi:conserved hypothetical integral membrane protein